MLVILCIFYFLPLAILPRHANFYALYEEIFCARHLLRFKYSCLSATPICISDNKAYITAYLLCNTLFCFCTKQNFIFASDLKIVLKRSHIISNFQQNAKEFLIVKNWRDTSFFFYAKFYLIFKFARNKSAAIVSVFK